jgi:hypothetical protein
MKYCIIQSAIHELETDSDHDAAARAVLDAELDSVPVWSGDPYDGNSESVKTDLRIFAHKPTPEEKQKYDESNYAANAQR